MNAIRQEQKRPVHGDATGLAAFELTSLFGFVLYRLSSSLAALGERDAQEAAGLSLPEYRCLTVLATKGGMGVIALCHAMLIDKAWVSRTLGRLEAKGLVASASDREDARRTVYSVTPAGRRLARLLIRRAIERQSALLDGFSERDVTQLHERLERMQHNADRLKAREPSKACETLQATSARRSANRAPPSAVGEKSR